MYSRPKRPIPTLAPYNPAAKQYLNLKPFRYTDENMVGNWRVSMTHDQSQPLSSENLKHSLDQRPESPQRPLKIAKVGDEELTGDEREEREAIGSDRTMSGNPRIQRYFVAIEYIGTRFSGAQQQSTGRTVVGVLEVNLSFFIQLEWNV